MKNRKLIFTVLAVLSFGLIAGPVFAQNDFYDLDELGYDYDGDYDDYDEYDDYGDYDEYDDYGDYDDAYYERLDKISDMTFLVDEVGLLSDEQHQEIASYLLSLSADYEIGLYITIINDYEKYASNIELANEKIFEQKNFGLGNQRSSLSFLMSMDDRSFDLDAHGYGNVAFSDSRRNKLIEAFTPDFKNNDWYNGFISYLETAYYYLDEDRQQNANYETGLSQYKAVQAARAMEVNRNHFLLAGGIALLVALIFALIRLASEKKRMRNVAFATEADSYIAESGVEMHEQKDIYKYSTTFTRTIETSSRSGGGGGGGHSHSSGHF